MPSFLDPITAPGDAVANQAGGILGAANQALVGGSNTPSAASSTDADIKYIRGIDIDQEDETPDPGQAVNQKNEHDANLPLEFIHFDRVHVSYSHLFPHPAFQDDANEKAMTDGMRPRGIQFRSALVRETVLLHGFVMCTQKILQARDDSKGAAGLPGGAPTSATGAFGSAMNALGGLAGESGGGSGQTKASDYDAPLQAVVSAIKPLLPQPVSYKDTHKAGCDLHDARNQYRKLLKQSATEKPQAGAGGALGGLASSITSSLSSVGGKIGDVIAFAQKIAFAPQDIRVKFYAKIAVQQEPRIETACHDMTLAAITAKQNPVLPVWFGDPNAKPTDATWQGAPDRMQNQSGLLGKAVNPVAGAYNDVRDPVVNTANDVKSFFDNPTPPTPPPGGDFLAAAFEVDKTPARGSDPQPMELGALAVNSFVDAAGLPSPIPTFCETIITKIYAASLDFVRGLYDALLARDSQQPITDDSLYSAALNQLQLTERLEALALDNVGFLKKLKETPLGLDNFSITPGDLMDKEADKMEQKITDLIKPVVEKALKEAMKELAAELDAARQAGNSYKCLTMEWYLARLPWVQSTLFCNLFFPFWNAVLRAAMDFLDPASASIIKTIVGAAGKANDYVTSANDDLEKAQALEQAGKNSVQKAQDGIDFLSDKEDDGHGQHGLRSLADGYGAALNKKAKQASGPSADVRAKVGAPLDGRVNFGLGQTVDQDLYNQVQPSDQWTNAVVPDTSVDKKDADAGAANTPAGAAPAS